jgi:hypothetical protein
VATSSGFAACKGLGGFGGESGMGSVCWGLAGGGGVG